MSENLKPLDIDIELDFTDVLPMSSQQRLKAGRYICSIEACAPYRYNNANTKGFRIQADLVDKKTGDTIQVSFNVAHPSAEAREIGQRQYRTFLEYGGYPTPEKPGKRAHEEMVGKHIGVHVVPEQYQDQRSGEIRDGSAVSSWTPFFDPEDSNVELGPFAKPNGATPPPAQVDYLSADDINQGITDDIPF